MIILFYKDLLRDQFKNRARGEIINGIRYWDCYGLAKEVLRRVGKTLPEFSYSEKSSLKERADLIEKNKLLFLTPINRPEKYCIVALQIVPEFVTHCGVVLEDACHFIHMSEKYNCKVDSIDSVMFRDLVRGFYRYEQ